MFPGSENRNITEALNYLPDTLKLLLSQILVGSNSTLKTASIGHCITQSARPTTTLAPLQLGLAVQMNHHRSITTQLPFKIPNRYTTFPWIYSII